MTESGGHRVINGNARISIQTSVPLQSDPTTTAPTTAIGRAAPYPLQQDTRIDVHAHAKMQKCREYKEEMQRLEDALGQSRQSLQQYLDGKQPTRGDAKCSLLDLFDQTKQVEKQLLQYKRLYQLEMEELQQLGMPLF
jgi:signal transduction protein with GAF and PtsI domain